MSTKLRETIHAWIREDAPLSIKMALLPSHVDALANRLAALSAEGQGQHPDDVAIDRFAEAMKAKMKFAREHKGRGGWEGCSPETLRVLLHDHVTKGDPVDVANFCMMLHAGGYRTISDEGQGQVPSTATITFDAATGQPTTPVKVIPNSDEARNLRAQRDDANERANRLAEFLRHKGLQAEYYEWLEGIPLPAPPPVSGQIRCPMPDDVCEHCGYRCTREAGR